VPEWEAIALKDTLAILRVFAIVKQLIP